MTSFKRSSKFEIAYKISLDFLISANEKLARKIFRKSIEYDIFGEGSQISTNQKRGNSAFSLLIG